MLLLEQEAIVILLRQKSLAALMNSDELWKFDCTNNIVMERTQGTFSGARGSLVGTSGRPCLVKPLMA